MLTSVAAVLFDLDGTLADTAPDLGNALNRLRVIHGKPPLAPNVIRPFASHGARGLLEIGFQLNPDDAQFIPMRDELLGYYEENLCVETVLFHGVFQLLTALEARSLPWGIVTNKAKRFTEPLVKQLGLHRRAACVVSGDTCARAKPYPDPLLFASEKLGLAASRCVYVGDAERDIEAGRAAGMQTIVAGYGYIKSEETPDQWRATHIIGTPLALLKLL